MKRQQSTETLATAMGIARVAYQAIRTMLIDNLAPYQRAAWDYAALKRWSLTTSETALDLGISQGQASNVLKELHDYGLLSRQRLDAIGGYVYRVKGE